MGTRRRRGHRGLRARMVTTVIALGAFQAVGVVGAGVATADTGCTYNPATQTVTVTIDPGGFAALAVETAAAGLDSESPPGAILIDNGDGTGYEGPVGESRQCGSATNANTTSIVVLGQPGADEEFMIDNQSGGELSTSIAWAIDLGSHTALGGDTFTIEAGDDDDTVVVTDTAFTINGGGGSLLGVELIFVGGNDGDDVIDGSGATNAVLEVSGDADDDWIAPGQADGDALNGGAGEDTLSYAHRTTCTVIDVPAGQAGYDANCNGVLDGVEEIDTFTGFEAYETGSGDDTLTGSGASERFAPGAGDDVIDGAGGMDTLDHSGSTADMVIDPNTGTATGSGDDEFSSIEIFWTGSGDDTLIFEGGVVGWCGGPGVDTVDASAEAVGVTIDLEDYNTAGGCANWDLENAIGGDGNDEIFGNVLGNRLWGGPGHDLIEGGLGNDFIEGGPGNDRLFGGAGFDTVSYRNAPAGVTVDNQLGFATGGDGEDEIGFFERVVGSAFDDMIIGGQTAFDANNVYLGRGGNDVLIGTNSTDILRGGPGHDELRAAGGDDVLRGGAGNDLLIGGRGDDILRGGRGDDVLIGGPGVDTGFGGPGFDVCRGIELPRPGGRGCESNRLADADLGRLVSQSLSERGLWRTVAATLS